MRVLPWPQCKFFTQLMKSRNVMFQSGSPQRSSMNANDHPKIFKLTFQLPLAVHHNVRSLKKMTHSSSYPVNSTNVAAISSLQLKFITLENSFDAEKLRPPRNTFRSRNSYFIARYLLGKHFAFKMRDINIARAIAMASSPILRERIFTN